MISESSVSLDTHVATEPTTKVRGDSRHTLAPPAISVPSNPIVKPTTTVVPTSYFPRKYFWDRVIGGLLLIPALPVIGVLIVLVRLTSRGPGVYQQERVGLDGKHFQMYKIRSMRVDAETHNGPQWSQPNDPRITLIGRLLRFLHLDELPQLFQVVKGEMSIIGPRPERPSFVESLSEEVDGYRDRLAVKPGITGLAQIYLPPDETTDCVRRKLCYDREYIQSACFSVDLRIFLCTVVRMFGVRKGWGPRWFGLDRRYQQAKLVCQRIGKPQPAVAMDHRFDAGRRPEPVVESRHALLEQPLQSQYDELSETVLSGPPVDGPNKPR